MARFVLFKYGVVSAHDSHFAGGKHAFLCMAAALAARGHEVHAVSVSSRSKVLVHAAMSGLLPLLSFGQPGVVSWLDGSGVRHHVVLSDGPQQQAGGGGGRSAGLAAAVAACVRDLVDAGPLPPPRRENPAAAAPPPPSAAAAADGADAAEGLASGPPSSLPSSSSPTPVPTWVLIDADESQKRLPGDPVAAPAAASDPAARTLFEAVLAAAPRGRCVALVQNVHFLPLGPSGTGPRSRPLLAAWSRLAGIVAVSRFVADYMRQHWPQAGEGPAAEAQAEAAPAGPGGADERRLRHSRGGDGGSGGGAGGEAAKPPGARGMPPVRVVPLATWGVYGAPPYEDLAAAARPVLHAWRAAQAAAAAAAAAPPLPPAAPPCASASPWLETDAAPLRAEGRAGLAAAQDLRAPPAASQALPPPLPVVAVLKLTPEKGCAVVLELARRLAGRVRFRV
ncbi:hypothetical protein TSOC_014950, partial [Tetrabaena socialis]